MHHDKLVTVSATPYYVIGANNKRLLIQPTLSPASTSSSTSSSSSSSSSSSLTTTPSATGGGSSRAVAAVDGSSRFDAPTAVEAGPGGARVDAATARRPAEPDRADALERAVSGVGAEAAVTTRTAATRVNPDVAVPTAETRRTGAQAATARSDVAQSCSPKRHNSETPSTMHYTIQK